MSNAYHSLATSDFSQNWSGSGLFTADDNWANVPSINGYRGDGLASATNVDPRTLTAASTSGGTIDVNFNQTAPNTFTTGGVTRFSGANVGNDTVVALAGSGTARAPSLVFYLDATGRSNITFSARLRDLESSADNAIQQVALQYRVSPTADWQNVSYVADATSGPSLAGSDITLTGTLGSDANGQSQVEVRVLTTDAAGSDEWVGIDDISITSVPVGNSATLAVNDVSIVEGDAGTSLLTFTVTRSNDTTAFSVNYGTGDGTASVGSDYVAATGMFVAVIFQVSHSLCLLIGARVNVAGRSER